MAASASSMSPRPTGRPPVKQRAIVDLLHRQILEGVFPPGSQLPTRRDLVAQFGGSFLSVQQALDQLVSERFVEARGPAGTFVSDRPPHLYDYALLVGQTPQMPGFRRFWAALSNEAERLNQVPGSTRRIKCWFGIDGHMDNEDFQELTRLVQRRRLAGIIFASSPYQLVNTSILESPGIPRVAIAGTVEHFKDTTRVELDTESFIRRAVNRLADAGRKRVAMMCVPGFSSECLDAFKDQLQVRGMTTRPYWTLKIEPSMGSAVREIAHLLMNPDQTVRPDALIIADDNLVEPVTTGLLDAGVGSTMDLDIVAHCNFPWATPSALPVCRIGFDAGEVLDTCLRALDKQQKTRVATNPITVNARFEHEISIPQETHA